MRTERAVFVLAIACGILLLLAPLTPRTSWVGMPINEIGSGAGGMVHSAGWEWVTTLCGIVALANLAFGRWLRPVVVASVVSAAAAAVAFLVAGLAAGGHWLDGATGALAVGRMVTYSAPAAPFFAVVAALGVTSAIPLVLSWSRSPNKAA